MRSDDFKYPIESLKAIEDSKAKHFLVEVGMPASHLLFTASSPEILPPRDNGVRHRLLVKIGSTSPYEEICIDAISGEVVSVNNQDYSVWHVNASVESFSKCLLSFSEAFPFGGYDAELEEREQRANSLARQLEGIDSTVLAEDPGFWSGILADIAIGDYSED
jgi:hypothetical protein